MPEPRAPRRTVPDWEYRTAYIPTFQVRLPLSLSERICTWAREAHKPVFALMCEILEEAVRRHLDEAR